MTQHHGTLLDLSNIFKELSFGKSRQKAQGKRLRVLDDWQPSAPCSQFRGPFFGKLQKTNLRLAASGRLMNFICQCTHNISWVICQEKGEAHVWWNHPFRYARSDYKEQFGLFLAIVCISSASVPRHHHCQRAPAPITGGKLIRCAKSHAGAKRPATQLF